ncbi:FeoA family protein [Desulfurobacterium sp.]
MKTLLDIEEGQTVEIKEIKGGPCFKRRLAAVGIFPGSTVRVVKNAPGPIIVEVEKSRFALGRGMARRIVVR